MLEKALSRSIRLICLGGVTLGMSAAFAQTARAESQKVTVTGSRISSPNAESPSPLQVLSSADIAQSGATNLQELLLENPTMGTPAISRTNSNFSTASAGVATVDLRNLGTDAHPGADQRPPRRVGRARFDSAVDLNTIPTDFIERVELLTGGASATYGSDAVAGVVNIILKKNFNGVLADASVGGSEQGDDAKRKLSLTFGTTSADGASNVMGHFGYSRQGAVYSSDRDASAVDQYSTGALTGNADDLFKPPVRTTRASRHRAASSTTPAASPTTQPATRSRSRPTAAPPSAATGFNRSEFRTIAVPTERYNFATSGNLALNEEPQRLLRR